MNKRQNIFFFSFKTSPVLQNVSSFQDENIFCSHEFIQDVTENRGPLENGLAWSYTFWIGYMFVLLEASLY